MIEAEYEMAHDRLQEAIKQLQIMIHNMPAPGGETKIDWGHIGTVNNITQAIEELCND